MNNHKKLCRDLYAYYVENGICTKCGCVWAEPGHSLCKACAKKAKEREKQADPNGEQKRERMRRIREERKKSGLCFMCGSKTDGIHSQCRKCLELGKERALLARIRKRVKEGKA